MKGSASPCRLNFLFPNSNGLWISPAHPGAPSRLLITLACPSSLQVPKETSICLMPRQEGLTQQCQVGEQGIKVKLSANTQRGWQHHMGAIIPSSFLNSTMQHLKMPTSSLLFKKKKKSLLRFNPS